jgi:hypothetical protein
MADSRFEIRNSKLQIDWPADVSEARMIARIEAACTGVGLTITLRGTLRANPGCVHWHTKRGRQSGTLEITLWPQEHEAWFAVHANRNAPWISDAIAEIVVALSRHND